MRKIVFIAETAYPDPSVASIRVGEWAKHLPSFGWKPHIICRYRGFESTPDQTIQNYGSPIEIHRLGKPKTSQPTISNNVTKEKLRLFKRFLATQLSAFMIPDVVSSHWKSHWIDIQRILEDIKPDVVLTSSPPHSIHHVGLRLKRHFQEIKWIADFRDPALIGNAYQPRGLAKLFHSQHVNFFKSVYTECDYALHAIPIHHRWVNKKFNTGHKSKLITNGYSDEIRQHQSTNTCDGSQLADPKKIRAFTAGHFPEETYKLLISVRQRLLSEGIDFEFHHYGGLSFGAQTGNGFYFHGERNYRDLIAPMNTMDIFIAALSKHRSSCLNLTSKCFDPIAISKPLLMIRPTKSDRLFFKKFRNTKLISTPTAGNIHQGIIELLSRTLTPEDPVYIDAYSRRNLTDHLSSVLTQICDN